MKPLPHKRNLLVLILLFAAGSWMTARSLGARPFETSLARRLLGPVAEVASAWQWVRVSSAFDDGRMDLAYARAEFALDLAPQTTGGWAYLASKLAFDRASPDREKDPVMRTRWTNAGLDLLVRGEGVAQHPAELALLRGLVLVQVGDSEGEIPWPGGAAGAWQEAQAAFARAASLDPGSSEPWAHLAANLCLRLSSPQLVADLHKRQAALTEALEFLDRGLEMEHQRQPAALHFQRGALLGTIGESPDGTLWPGGRAALFTAAVEAFQRAEALHFPLAKVAREAAQEILAKVRAIELQRLPE